MSEPEQDDYDAYEDQNPVFVNCICDHEPDQHGWGECNVDDCDCEGGWEE